MSKFVPYGVWALGAERRATPHSHPIGQTKGITAHWEGPKMGAFPHSACARKVRAIRRFHQIYRGWADIAYNLVVCPHGYVFEGRGAGTKSAANGSTQTNDDWYAVCYLGGLTDPFTDEGREGFKAAFAHLTRHGSAGPERNGHRDHKATACPGDEIHRWVHSDFEEDDMSWNEQIDVWQPGDKNPDDTMRAGQQLNQARGYAEEAARNTAKILRLLDPGAIADAVVDRLGGSADYDTVKRAVKDALAEGIVDEPAEG